MYWGQTEKAKLYSLLGAFWWIVMKDFVHHVYEGFRLSFVLQILAHPVGRKSAHPPTSIEGCNKNWLQ